jgi:hypothetical protein
VKIVFSIPFCLFLFLGNPLGGAQETFSFQNQFTPGEQLYLTLQTEMKGVNRTGEEEYPVLRTLDAVMLFKTHAVVDGMASVDKYLVDIAATDPDNRFPVITMKKLMGSDLIASPTGFDPVQLSPYVISSMRMDPQGRIHALERSGTASPLEKAVQSTSERQPWLVFPSEPLVLGATWTETLQVPLPVSSKPVLTDVVYTLLRVWEENGEPMAQISYTQKISAENTELNSSRGNQNVHLKLQIKYNHYSISSEGTLDFNRAKGYVTVFRSVSEMHLDMDTQAGLSDVNFPSHTEMKLTSKTAGTISPQIPERLLNKEKANDETK